MTADKAYFERGFIAAYAWMLTKRADDKLSDAVIDRAWEHRDEGMHGDDVLPVPSASPIISVEHPMASASLVEVFDYAALRLNERKADGAEFGHASVRFDEAYMWLVAALNQEHVA